MVYLTLTASLNTIGTVLISAEWTLAYLFVWIYREKVGKNKVEKQTNNKMIKANHAKRIKRVRY